MSVRPPVYLHFVGVNQIAPSPQAVPRDAVGTRVGLQAHAAPVHRPNMHRPGRLNRLRADAGRQLNASLAVALSSLLAQQFRLCLQRPLHRGTRSTNAGTCSRRDDVGGNIYGSRDRFGATPQRESTTTHAWLCSRSVSEPPENLQCSSEPDMERQRAPRKCAKIRAYVDFARP